jgi:hypothetical protein
MIRGKFFGGQWLTWKLMAKSWKRQLIPEAQGVR